MLRKSTYIFMILKVTFCIQAILIMVSKMSVSLLHISVFGK